MCLICIVLIMFVRWSLLQLNFWWAPAPDKDSNYTRTHRKILHVSRMYADSLTQNQSKSTIWVEVIKKQNIMKDFQFFFFRVVTLLWNSFNRHPSTVPVLTLEAEMNAQHILAAYFLCLRQQGIPQCIIPWPAMMESAHFKAWMPDYVFQKFTGLSVNWVCRITKCSEAHMRGCLIQWWPSDALMRLIKQRITDLEREWIRRRW